MDKTNSCKLNLQNVNGGFLETDCVNDFLFTHESFTNTNSHYVGINKTNCRLQWISVVHSRVIASIYTYFVSNSN